MNKLTWREISAMLGSCCCSLMFGNSYMFTKRIVGEVTVFALLSWRFLIGAVFSAVLLIRYRDLSRTVHFAVPVCISVMLCLLLQQIGIQSDSLFTFLI